MTLRSIILNEEEQPVYAYMGMTSRPMAVGGRGVAVRGERGGRVVLRRPVVGVGLGRIAALRDRSFILYQIHLLRASVPPFRKWQCDRTVGWRPV